MRTLLISFSLLLVSSALAVAQDGPPSNATNDDRYQMLAIGNRAMLLDREEGKSWLLAAKGGKAAWIPIQKLDESSIASGWLKANLPARTNTSREKVSMIEAARQVKLEEISQSEVAAEPFNVLVAREKAELSRLKGEYGDRHPEVLACRNRLIELLKVGSKDDADK